MSTASLGRDWDRLNKNALRSSVLPTKPVGSSLFLPSGQALDVLESLSRGVLKPRGRHFLVEREPEVTVHLRASLPDPLPKSIEIATCELLDFRPPVPLEYAYIDLCGAIGSELGLWLRGLPLAPGADVVLALCLNPRGSRLLDTYGDWHRTLPNFQEHLRAETGALRGGGSRFPFGPKIRHNLSLFSVLVQSIYRNYDYDFVPPTLYRDEKHEMVVFRLRNLLVRAEASYPDFLPALPPEPDAWHGPRTILPVPPVDARPGELLATLKRLHADLARLGVLIDHHAIDRDRRFVVAALKAHGTRNRLDPGTTQTLLALTGN